MGVRFPTVTRHAFISHASVDAHIAQAICAGLASIDDMNDHLAEVGEVKVEISRSGLVEAGIHDDQHREAEAGVAALGHGDRRH